MTEMLPTILAEARYEVVVERHSDYSSDPVRWEVWRILVGGDEVFAGSRRKALRWLKKDRRAWRDLRRGWREDKEAA